MASCVGGGRPPPQHNVSVTRRLRSQVQMCNETNTGEGFYLGESEDGRLSPRSVALGRNDVWRVGRVALCPGFVPRGDGDMSGFEKPFTEIKTVKAPLRIEVALLCWENFTCQLPL